MNINESNTKISAKGNCLSASCLYLICTLVLSIVLPPVVHAALGDGDIVTIAGGGTGVPGDGGLATSATLSCPTGVSSVDAFGNIYIADTSNHRIRKVDYSSGTITTVAGNGTPAFSGDAGPATLASLDHPTGVSIDTLGNIYIADTSNHRIRKVDYSSGTITTVAGNGTGTYSGDYGPATSASLYYPYGVSVDASGNIYIADKYNHRIRKIASGTISTLAGNGTGTYSGDDGPATSASLNYPEAVFVDASGNIYIADTFNHRIRKVDHSSGTITTLAGNGNVIYFVGEDNGPATSASLECPSGVSADALGNIYIADYTHNRIRRVDASGTISTLAGNGTGTYSGDNGLAISAGLNNPSGVSADALENVYIADYHNHRIRKVSPSPGIKVTDSIPPSNDHKLLFGTVTQGNTSDQTVTVTNSGTIGLVIGTISPPASLFSIPIPTDNCSNQPIAPSASCTLIVRFTPTSPGYVSDSFDIPSNDPKALTVTFITSGTGTTSSVPKIQVTDAIAPNTDLQMPFGAVTQGNTSQQTITVTNNGNADLIISTIDHPVPPFSITADYCSGQTITSGSTCTLTVGFAPSAVGTFAASFNIPSNDPDTPTIIISLSGTGTPTPVPHITVIDSVAPFDDLQVNFGNVTQGMSSSANTVTIFNTGNADLTITNIQITGTDAAQFILNRNGGTAPCGSATPSVATGSNCTVTVTYSPTSTGAKSATLAITSNDLNAATVNVNMSGTGTAVPVPHITVTDSVAPIDDLKVPFGNVTQGNTLDQTVTVTNSGNANLNISTINQPSAPFSITTDNCSGQTIAPASTCTLTVRFSPSAVGTLNGSFVIPSNDPNTATVTVNMSGTGTAVPVPHITVTDSITPGKDLQMPFGNVTQGVTSPVQAVGLSNTGNAGLTITGIQITGTDAGQFNLNLNGGAATCGSATPSIAAGSNCTVIVTFSPTSIGTKSATLAIASNDPGSGTVDVTLSGTGLSSVTNNLPSTPALIFPANGQTGLGTTVQFRWKKATDPDGDTVTYHLYTCTDQSFSGCTPVDVASSQANKIYFAGLGMYGGLMMIGMVFAGSRKGRKGLLLLIVIVLLTTGITLASCGGGGGSTPSPQDLNEISYEVSNLSPGTTYYWKVVADDAKGGTTGSAVWSFKMQ